MAMLASITAGHVHQAAAGDEAEVIQNFRLLIGLCQSNGLLIDGEAISRAVARSVVEQVDPGSRILSAAEKSEWEKAQSGITLGVGLRYAVRDGVPVLTEILDESLLDCSLRTGDVIAAVGDYATDGLYHTDVDHLLSCTGGTLSLRIRRPDGSVTDCVANCTQVVRPSVELVEYLPRGVVYLKVNGLFADAGELVEKLIALSNDISGVVIDLRGAGGTNLPAVADVASLFVSAGQKLLTVELPDGTALQTYEASARGSVDMPAMILVDKETKCAAEVLAAVLGKLGRQVLVIGQPTAGDPCVRNFWELPGGDYAYMVHRRIILADGTVLNGRNGVEPDIEVNEEAEPMVVRTHRHFSADTPEEEKLATLLQERLVGDPALERAVDTILGLKALGLR